MKRSAVATAVALLASVALVSGHAFAQDVRHAHAEWQFLSTKTPYAPQEGLGDYQRPPHGFTPIFTETVSRHGSRAMTDSDDGDSVVAVLNSAARQSALTPLGAQLAPRIRSLLTGAASIGYGNLSGLGAREQRQTALRMERRLPSLFRTIRNRREPIEVETSGVPRTVASANAFTSGLVQGDPGLVGLIRKPVADKDLLYFHKQPQNADYQAYLSHDPELGATLTRIDGEPRTARAAKDVFSRLFGPDFVAATSTADQIDFSRSLYELYSVAPDLRIETPNSDLDAFLPARDAEWFAYLDDAEEFYEKGPAFRGRTITYKMANVLLDDLFRQAEAKASGTSGKGAVLRFTHAEEIEPLAVLLGLPGSTRAADPSRPYTYRNNPWRGARVAPMAANVQWDVYAGPRDGGGTEHLVRMLYNERETAFKASCRPVARGSYFYDLAELERCLHRG
ncbi:histidine-type phosphatase [Streptomyces silvisoli]|uniref:Multiple inositol polyphosphate phosphatase 1 n=1 Tax=Streptomyces silvisoli TaxID=3034235 RepID=A0ABT5ZJ27_9ACTN|nr:histidine-type phosphatase [Streptomyces silvisoli]MDF3289829.1 histidine-type phosphatase [Streptomyces silvisoli]